VLSKLFTKKFLGIDIGTSSVKIAEIEKSGDSFSLSNYGYIDFKSVEGVSSPLSKKAITALSSDEIVEVIQAVLSEAKIKTRECAFSIADFLTFFTAFSLPQMTEKELSEAVMFEARQHIPLPMDSVTVDWQKVGQQNGESKKVEITVEAIPNEIIAQYKEIAQKANLQIILMEAEAFGLAQVLIGKDEERPVCLVDIGFQSTVCSLVHKNILRYSHSFDRGQNYLMREFFKSLPIDRQTARRFEEKYGLEFIAFAEPEIKDNVGNILRDSMSPILKEIEMAINDFGHCLGADIGKIIISGGVVAVPEVKGQFDSYFQKKVEIADPFKEIKYPPAIEAEIKSMAPMYAVAVGMARRAFEFKNRPK